MHRDIKVKMNTAELRKYIVEVMSENKYAICTASIAKTAGTTERSKWSAAAIKRYEDCKEEVIEGRDRARKSTGQYQDLRIKAKEMLWAYFDEELGAMDARASKRIGNKPSDNLVDEIFNAIMDSVPAEVPDDVKRARKAAEEKKATDSSPRVKVVKPLKPQPKKKQSLGQRFAWSGLGENTMKITAASLKQIVREELGMDQQAVGKGPEQVALDNLTAAVKALVQNHGYTTEDIVDVVAAEEGSEVVYALKGDQVVSVREGEKEELEECGYSEEEEEEPTRRYFKI
jgi:hypothetical protein